MHLLDSNIGCWRYKNLTLRANKIIDDTSAACPRPSVTSKDIDVLSALTKPLQV
jgi:hypothetical protein